MASRGTTFAKLDRERAKKAKAAEKRERRLAQASEAPAAEPTAIPDGEELSAATLLRLVEELHEAFADKRISFEDFEARKTELMARISVD